MSEIVRLLNWPCRQGALGHERPAEGAEGRGLERMRPWQKHVRRKRPRKASLLSRILWPWPTSAATMLSQRLPDV